MGPVAGSPTQWRTRARSAGDSMEPGRVHQSIVELVCLGHWFNHTQSISIPQLSKLRLSFFAVCKSDKSDFSCALTDCLNRCMNGLIPTLRQDETGRIYRTCLPSNIIFGDHKSRGLVCFHVYIYIYKKRVPTRRVPPATGFNGLPHGV